MNRRQLLALLAGSPLISLGATVPESHAGVGVLPHEDWPLLAAYLRAFMTSDGRIVDVGAGGHSTSEGQSYAMFFSLVANDRETFDRVFGWAVDNLAAGDLGARLPGWKWGQRDDKSWGLVDPNAASDADLWIAYCLLEGGRLWDDHALADAGRALLRLIAEQEVADLAGLGPMMLPGPEGFDLGKQRWRLNPSYLPMQLLERARHADPEGPWDAVKRNTTRLFREASPHGLLPDWVVWSEKHGFAMDPVTGDLGSYDAIRCTLWAAMLDDDEPAKGIVAGRASGLGRHWRTVNKVSAAARPWTGNIPGDKAPVGFLGALLPEVDTWGDPEMSARIRQQIDFEKRGELYGTPATYYDSNLLLFGLGYGEHRYRFERDGRLVVSWRPT